MASHRLPRRSPSLVTIMSPRTSCWSIGLDLIDDVFQVKDGGVRMREEPMIGKSDRRSRLQNIDSAQNTQSHDVKASRSSLVDEINSYRTYKQLI